MRLYLLFVTKVGNCSPYLDNPFDRAGRESQALYRPFQKNLALGRQLADALDRRGGHLGVAAHAFEVTKALLLDLAGHYHPLANGGGGFAGGGVHQVAVGDRGDLHLDVDAV
jgi:hypothetical protein